MSSPELSTVTYVDPILAHRKCVVPSIPYYFDLILAHREYIVPSIENCDLC